VIIDNSCPANSYYQTYQIYPVSGETVYAEASYSVGSTCLHSFTYTNEFDVPSNSSLQWHSIITCGAIHTTQCTSQQNLNNDPLRIRKIIT